ncbi:MAG: hypothetical protein U9O82_09765 [Thermodesulfobacteriota bacterium]|nr:hypothetical protein [Thermodesulfobacteriota bacterium]
MADVFDALTSARPYRDSRTIEKAFHVLVEGVSRNQFDRETVLNLISCLRDDERDKESSIFFSDLTQINWKFLKVLDSVQYPPEGYKCLKTCGTTGVTYNFGVFLPQKTRKLPLRH